MNFLEPAKFPSVEAFKTSYAQLDDKDKIAELHRQLQPHLLRRLKKDVLKQLPPKMEQMVRLEMSDEQRQLYKAILSKNYEALVGELLEGWGYGGMGGGRGLGGGGGLASEATEQLVAASGKLALLDRMMLKLKAAGHRVLIYSQFTKTLDVLEDWVVGRGWGYERIDGDVAGGERQRRVDAFNRNPVKKFVFLLSTRAGGLGINLATADTVIIYDSDWNPHNDLQALARAHRMGQKSSVMVFRLVTRGTIEERMLQRAKSKMVLEHLVVAKAAKASKLEQQALDDILRYGAKELFAEDEDLQQQQCQQLADEQQQAGGDQQQPGTSGAPAAADGSGQVANFDMVVDKEEPEQQPPAAEAAAAGEEPLPPAAGEGADHTGLGEYDPSASELNKTQEQFWQGLLGQQHQEQQQAAAEAAPQAAAEAARTQRRAAARARYTFFDSASSESGSEEEPSDVEEPEEEDAEAAAEAAAGGKRKRRRKKAEEEDDVNYEVEMEQASSGDG
eukprot:gene5696-5934_t